MNSLLHNQKVYLSKYNYEKKLDDVIHNRDNFLNKTDINKIHNRILKKHDIIFLANDINESLVFENYKLIIHGILQCGSKTTIIINNIFPYVDILYNIKKTDKENIDYLKTLFKHDKLIKMLKGKSIDFKSIKIVEGKHFMYFSETNQKFIRIYFNKLYHRICFIRLLNKLEINSYNNDLNNYHRVVSRTYEINLSSWNIIKNYSLLRNSNYKSKYVLNININDIHSFEEKEYESYNSIPNLSLDIDSYRKDKMISMSFDIEQYSSNFNPARPDIVILPSGKIKEDEIFNIGLTYQFINNPNSFLNIALLTKEANNHEDYLTIICDNECTLLKVFGYINNLIQPDFIMEFNGSEFDWINLYDKCVYYKIIQQICQDMSIKKLNSYELKDENIFKYFYNQDNVKISADVPQKNIRNINMEGYIPFDVRVIFMQLNPTEQKSKLSFYLDMNNLPNKDDMPIPELFKIYEKNDINGMTDVAHYCYIDAFRLHQLIFKNNIIQDKREVAKLSYTSLFDAFYRANGSKVRNLIIAKALKRNLFVNTIKKEEKEEDKMDGKYPGALVLDPKKGLVNNVLTIKEFCNDKLEIFDNELINKLQEIINNNYQAVYINKNINEINF
jgi:DNA polymerase elongation subunit (family B)